MATSFAYLVILPKLVKKKIGVIYLLIIDRSG